MCINSGTISYIFPSFKYICLIWEFCVYSIAFTPSISSKYILGYDTLADSSYWVKTFNLSKQFATSDVIVIAAPYWDLSFPAVLKNYLEQITVNGLTFRYGEKGIPEGLCKAKRLIYVTTSGGPIKQNFGYDYVVALAKGFYGIEDVQFVSAEGLDVYGADVGKIIEEAKQSFKL